MAATAHSTVFSCSILESRPGFISLKIEKGSSFFDNESGGQRWQRVPPNEKHGRRHTSTVTVAVLHLQEEREITVREEDIEWKATRGSGNGGQHKNVTDSAVQMKHLPTGITVRIENERSQGQNRKLALRVIAARVAELTRSQRDSAEAKERKRQVGSGMRGDKARTIRMQDGRVVDHRTGKKTSLDRYLSGHLEDLR